jgi:hypothetical protein
MAGEDSEIVVVDTDKKRKVESVPPDGYVCRLCSTPGHWIQVCPTKKTGAKRQRKSDHVPVPGQDPSPDDIEKAKLLQKIPPPNCKSFGPVTRFRRPTIPVNNDLCTRVFDRRFLRNPLSVE